METGDQIIRLAARGDGVSESGQFVSGGVPGDRLGANGSLIRGPHFREAACAHFGRCGGCQLQHVSEEAYCDYCVDRIATALAAQGIDPPEIRLPSLSPPESRRRASMRALKLGQRLLLGFAETGSNKLVDVNVCPIMHPALFALLLPIRGLLSSLISQRKPVEVHMTRADQGVDLLISGLKVQGMDSELALIQFAQTHALARLSLDDGLAPETLWAPEPVTVTLSGIPVALPHGAFLQATQDGEGALVLAVQEALGGAQQVADLFAGLGTFSFAHDGVCLAVEGARSAITALQEAANGARVPLLCDHRDLFRRPMMANELKRFDALIIDPPRAGAKEQMAEIAKNHAPVVASISCNPATFARDARILIDGGYRLDWIQPVGQFRWSTHVELAARFSR